MKRYDSIHGSQGGLDEYELGNYVLYEEARQIEVDRDIKAANLQLLVEKVLAYDGLDDHASVEDAVLAYAGMIELARSLKQ